MYVMETQILNWCHLLYQRRSQSFSFFNSICKKDLNVKYNHHLFKCQIRMISYQSISTYWTAVCTYIFKSKDTTIKANCCYVAILRWQQIKPTAFIIFSPVKKIQNSSIIKKSPVT